MKHQGNNLVKLHRVVYLCLITFQSIIRFILPMRRWFNPRPFMLSFALAVPLSGFSCGYDFIGGRSSGVYEVTPPIQYNGDST